MQLKEKRNNLHEKLAKRERKKEKKRRKQLKERGYSVEEFEENWSSYKRMAESGNIRFMDKLKQYINFL